MSNASDNGNDHQCQCQEKWYILVVQMLSPNYCKLTAFSTYIQQLKPQTSSHRKIDTRKGARFAARIVHFYMIPLYVLASRTTYLSLTQGERETSFHCTRSHATFRTLELERASEHSWIDRLLTAIASSAPGRGGSSIPTQPTKTREERDVPRARPRTGKNERLRKLRSYLPTDCLLKVSSNP